MLKITKIERVSTDSVGNEANAQSITAVLSPDGNKVAFVSDADNLVAGDTNNKADVFVKDLVTGGIERVSTDSAGNQGNNNIYNPVFTPDGKTLLFSGSASNLVADDTNGADDIFIKNLESQEIDRVLNNTGKQGNNYTFLVPNHLVQQQVISADGTKLVFSSFSSNFMSARDTNGSSDVFIRDMATGAIQTVSTNIHGNTGNNNSYYAIISPDAQKVAFYTEANNLIEGSSQRDMVVIKDLITGQTSPLITGESYGFTATFSPDSSKIAFRSSDPSLGGLGLYIKNFNTNTVELVSLNEAGERLDHVGASPVFSPDGSKIAFLTGARNLIEGREDYFGKVVVRDLDTGEMLILNEAIDLKIYNGNMRTQGAGFGLSFSADGSKLVFTSSSDTLVPGDTNGKSDVFVMTLTEVPLEGAAGETLHGGDHADKFMGTEDNDSLYGGDGRDNISGLAGHDRLYGESGFDTLRGGEGDDTLNGGNGEDALFGEAGHDRLVGGAASDSLRGGEGDDVLLGNSAEDFLDGGEGNDTLYGGTNDDELRGRGGDDRLVGEKGKDDLRGGDGDDTLNGGEGLDKLMGDAGADLFVFDATGAYKDSIRDFNAAEGDKVLLRGFVDLYKITGDGNNALKLTVSEQDTILNVIWKSTNPYWYYEVLHPICVFENQTGLSLQHMLASGQIELI